ncbi:MAG: PQQ-binding-like beta-propeller repeat protein [Halobacteriaceae archaeon]
MIRARRALAALTVALLTTAGVAVTGMVAGQPNSTAQPNWDAPRSEDGRTGATADDGPRPYGRSAWTAAGAGTATSGVVSDGDRVYAAWDGPDDPRGAVHSWNAATGEERWERTNVGNPMGSPTVGGDRLYLAAVGAPDPEFGHLEERRTGMYSLNATTGDVVWRQGETFSEPVYTDGRLVASVYAVENASYPREARDGGVESVTALDPETGDRIWTTNVSGTVLAAANGTVYVGSEAEDVLYALDVDDGSVRWRASVASDAVLSDSVAATGNAVYLVTRRRSFDESESPEGSEHPTVTAYAAADGDKRWTTTLSYSFSDEEPAYATAPAVADGTVYVTTPHAVVAMDAASGEEAWRFETDVTLGTDPAVGNGTLFVAGQRGEFTELRDVVYAVDADDGTEVWAYQYRAATQTGNYYTGVANGRLFVTGQSSGGGPFTTLAVYDGSTTRPASEHRVTDDAPVADDQPPTADGYVATESDDGYFPQNTTVTLSGNASSDDGEIVSYEWDVDGDGTYEKTGVTVEVQSPDDVGETKTVTLRVTDDAGQTDTDPYVDVRIGC